MRKKIITGLSGLILGLLLLSGTASAFDFPSFTYSFVAKQLISAVKIMANYNALKNAIVDGSKKINVAELWVDGELRVGNTGNIYVADITASGDVAFNDGLTVSGNISGMKEISLVTAAAVVLTVADCRSGMFVNIDDDVIDFTLPEVVAGLMVSFYSHFDQIITIDCHANDRIVLDNVKLTDGNAIDSPGQIGNVITLLGVSTSSWITFGRSGIWVDGGAD